LQNSLGKWKDVLVRELRILLPLFARIAGAFTAPVACSAMWRINRISGSDLLAASADPTSQT